jgi:hypothetical protein
MQFDGWLGFLAVLAMRSWNDVKRAIFRCHRVQMNSDGQHLLQHRRWRLDMGHASFDRALMKVFAWEIMSLDRNCPIFVPRQ